MTPVRIGVVAMLAVVAVVGAIALSGSGDGDLYEFRITMDNAQGLRDGSLITIGGVDVGTVDVELDDRDKVEVIGTLEAGEGPIGRDARGFISSVNLLGQKRLELVPGTVDDPAPSGVEIPADRIDPSTDLDQVLSVLTPDTRARLGVLLSEAGAATVGRKTDISRLIGTLPRTIASATTLLDEVVQDNETIGELVESSDSFIQRLVERKAQLREMVDTSGQAARTFAARRVELRETLAQAPGTLETLQRFLGELEQTTVPLGPAARDIAATAPELDRLLTELPPFQDAAAPTLDKVVSSAPALTRLAQRATPTVRRAAPTAGRLATFSEALVPVTGTLDKSADNLVAIVDNWSRAVQFRDGISHIFRGEAGFSPQTLESLLNRFDPANQRKRRSGTAPARTRPDTVAPAAPSQPAPAKPDPVKDLVDGLGVKPLLEQVLGNTQTTVQDVLGSAGLGQSQRDINNLLDYLLKP